MGAQERAGRRGRSRRSSPERDDECRAALERRGYGSIRHSFQMEIELARRAGCAGVAGRASTVRTYDPSATSSAVYEATQEAFADHWDFRRVSSSSGGQFDAVDPRFDPTLWCLVEDGDELAARLAQRWHFSGDPAVRLGRARSAVRRPWRRRGLGLALLRHSFRDFARRGATRVGLGVDAENTTGAVRLYERAGMRAVRRQRHATSRRCEPPARASARSAGR